MIYFDAQLSEWSPAAPRPQAMSCQWRVMTKNLFWLSVELEDVLAGGPVAPKAAKGAVSHLPVIINDEDKEEEDAGFELSSWV